MLNFFYLALKVAMLALVEVEALLMYYWSKIMTLVIYLFIGVAKRTTVLTRPIMNGNLLLRDLVRHNFSFYAFVLQFCGLSLQHGYYILIGNLSSTELVNDEFGQRQKPRRQVEFYMLLPKDFTPFYFCLCDSLNLLPFFPLFIDTQRWILSSQVQVLR